MAFENYELWDTHTLLGVYRETEAPSNYWLNLCFGAGEITFDDEYIDFEKIPSTGRKLAPFVMPLAQGRPIYEEQSRVHRFKPAYIKALDPVTPTRVLKRRPGSLLDPTSTSAAARYNSIKVDILAYHRQSIERRWEWLAARAVIDGKVTIESPDYPAVEVDFGRAADHTITLTGGSTWADEGVSIIDDIQDWSDKMHLAEFGGAPNRLTAGVDAWKVMRKDPEIRDLLDVNLRGSTVNIQRGLLPSGEVRFVGTLGTMEVWVYSDYYTEGGSVVPFMSSRDVVLTGPNVMGFRCFGAIQDAHANFQAMQVFPRNWLPQSDPAIEQILTQSAPLMVPVNPNATLKATVLEAAE